MSERLDRVEALLLQMAERQMAYESRFERIETRSAERQAAHEARFERIETEFSRLQLQLSETNATLDRVNAILDRVAEGQDRNELQIAANAEAIAQLRGEASDTKQRVEVLEEAA